MRNDEMRWLIKPCITMIAIAGMLAIVACTSQPTNSADRDMAMTSRPDLYRGTQYRPHPHGLNVRQTDVELAAGVAYNGCVAIVPVSMHDADAGRGLDCGSGGRIGFAPGVRYGDCTVLRPITLSEAESGAGLLCDTTTTDMRAALDDLRLRIARH
jgi:hypothetical protein